jgi:uronate dehydrogenase
MNDLVELLRCSLFARRVGHTITFGVSNNDSQWWDARHSKHLGFVAKDSSAAFAHKFPDSAEYPAKDDVTVIYQGGGFLLNTPQYKS